MCSYCTHLSEDKYPGNYFFRTAGFQIVMGPSCIPDNSLCAQAKLEYKLKVKQGNKSVFCRTAVNLTNIRDNKN